MAEIIEMPKLSDTMTEGTVGKWLKKEGDSISVGDVIAEIETDKATMEYEAPDEGVLLKILVPDGGRAACRAPIAVVGEKGEKVDESLLKSAAATSDKPAKEEKESDGAGSDKSSKEEKDSGASPKDARPAAPVSKTKPTPAQSSSPSTGFATRVKASPLARKVAEERGIDLASLRGTGPGGRVTSKDVESAPSGGGGEPWGFTGPGAVQNEETAAVSNMRRTIAARLIESKTTIPHFYVEIEVDAAPLAALRASLNKEMENGGKKVKLTVNDFILKAATEALRKVPALNAAWDDNTIHRYGAVHMAFAVTLPTGLITPVIRNAHTKGIKAISVEAKALGAKAKDGKLKPEEYTGGTFSVSNMGMMGISRFYPIINPPQAAILGVGGVINTPVINEHGHIVPGQRMILTLSADHRVVDGADAARYLNALKALLETPALLLL